MLRPSSKRIAVIGAGIAGLSAANALIQKHADVTVFEARHRIGGRIYTVNRNGNPLELGAQWIHGGCEDNSVFQLASSLDLFPDGVSLYAHGDLNLDIGCQFHCGDGRVLTSEVAEKAHEIYGDILDKAQGYWKDFVQDDPEHKDKSLREFFDDSVEKALNELASSGKDQKFLKDLTLALGSLRAAMVTYIGYDLDECSLNLYGSSEEHPGGDVIVSGGLKQLLDHLAEPLIQDDRLKLGHEVTHIDYSSMDAVALRILKGDQEETEVFDCVITTIPLGVLKKEHEKLFHPKLPSDKVNAMNLMCEGYMAKIFLEWDEPWWTSNPFTMYFAKELRQPRSHWTDDVFGVHDVECQPKLLMCFVGGKSGKEVDSLPDSEILIQLYKMIKRYAGDQTIPVPQRVIRHAWSLDENNLGGYSQPLVGMTYKDLTALSSPIPTEENPLVMFAGEACHPDHWSNMHGARLTGLREAERTCNTLSL